MTQCSLAGPQPYRQICSTANDKPNANAHTNHIMTSQRNSQNFRAIGVRSCSLYALDSKIFKPLPESELEKMLNFRDITGIISQKELFLYIKIKKMQNTPRIFLNQILESGKSYLADKEVIHYLLRVMRRRDCLVFNHGVEYNAVLSDDDKYLIIGDKTNHIDPVNDLIFCFAPIKKTDDLLNMVTQMGVAVIQPVITRRTVAAHINWQRMKKIIVEASEQSGRNSIPQLLPSIKFEDIDLSDMIVADERAAHGVGIESDLMSRKKILVGPEGGFSPDEFEKIDNSGAVKMSLGKTILRAEVAAVVAIAKVLNK